MYGKGGKLQAYTHQGGLIGHPLIQRQDLLDLLVHGHGQDPLLDGLVLLRRDVGVFRQRNLKMDQRVSWQNN